MMVTITMMTMRCNNKTIRYKSGNFQTLRPLNTFVSPMDWRLEAQNQPRMLYGWNLKKVLLYYFSICICIFLVFECVLSYSFLFVLSIVLDQPVVLFLCLNVFVFVWMIVFFRYSANCNLALAMQWNNPEIYQPVSLTAVNLLVAQPSASPHLEDEDDDYHLNDDINFTPSTLMDVDDD